LSNRIEGEKKKKKGFYMSAEKKKKAEDVKLGRVSAEIQAGVDKGYLGALDESDPYVKQLKEISRTHKCVVSVRDTVEERASYIKRYTKEELEAAKGKGWK
jgi:hypothetical protein